MESLYQPASRVPSPPPPPPYTREPSEVSSASAPDYTWHDLERENIRLRDRLREAVKDSQDLRIENKELEIAEQDIRNQLQTAEKTMKEIVEIADRMHCEHHAVRRQMATAHEQSLTVERYKYEKIQGELDALRKTSSEWENERRELRRAIDFLGGKIGKQEEENQQLRLKIKEMEVQVEETKQTKGSSMLAVYPKILETLRASFPK